MARGEAELIWTHGKRIVRSHWPPTTSGRLQTGHDDYVDDEAEQDVDFDLVQTGFVEHPAEGEPAHEPDDTMARDLQEKWA